MLDIILCNRMQRCQIHPLLWHDGRTPAAKPNYSVSEGSLRNWTFNPCQIFEINCLQHWTWLFKSKGIWFLYFSRMCLYLWVPYLYICNLQGEDLKSLESGGSTCIQTFFTNTLAIARRKLSPPPSHLSAFPLLSCCPWILY